MSSFLIVFILLFNTACDSNEIEEKLNNDKAKFAKVEKVSFTGKEGNYNFSVTLKSPDTGCQQYADWWEVISEKGDLIYRRILAHSHVNEQPFERSGGSVNINANDVVIIRGHMNNSGYGEGDIAMKGSVSSGFQSFTVSKDFASDLDKESPLPSGCAF